MHAPLDNPVYQALISGNRDKALGTGGVRYFHPEVSPFAGFAQDNEGGFEELHRQLPAGQKTLFASREPVSHLGGWQLVVHVPGTQFIYPSKEGFDESFPGIVPLDTSHVEQMIALARLTKPGPFDRRTIEFGNYEGIFEGEHLAAMTGRRLHVHDHMEVSAVCTHPQFLGKGYAGLLLKHQVNSILGEGMVPFLHVRSDNERAISLYKMLGFVEAGPMHFYFLQK